LLDQIETKDAQFKAVGQAAKQRRLVREFKLIERRHNRIRLLSSLEIIDERIEPSLLPMKSRYIFREEPQEKKRVIADVFAYLSFVDERPAFQEWIGSDKHLANVFETFAVAGANSVEIVNMAEINENARDVFGSGDIVQLSRSEEASVNEFRKQCAQGMMLTNGSGHLAYIH
jgi:hypothetical protein